MQLSSVVKSLIHRMGSKVNVFKNGNATNTPDTTLQGLKNSNEETGAIIFQFSEAQDIGVGDVIALAEARDRWAVIEVEDVVIQGNYSHFEITVEKVGKYIQQNNMTKQNVTYNLNGPNARVNNQSTDNSTNISIQHNDNIAKLISDLREEVMNLGEEKNIENEALEVVSIIETQAMQQKPNRTILESTINGLATLLPHAANIAGIGSLILAAVALK